MSGDEMADEDRPAAPDDGRSASDDNGSDWFFRDRSRDDESRAAQPGRDDYRPGPDQYPDAAPTQYYGPFGGSARPVDEPTQVLPSYGAAPPPPTFAHPTGYPVAGGVPPLAPPPSTGVAAVAPAQTPPQQPVRRSRTGLILVVAALLAALVGTAAGYGGARLAQTGAPAVAPSVPAQPTVAPRPTASSSADPQSPVPAAPSQIDTVQVAASALPSTVMIRVGSSGSGGTGSGFVLDTEGHIMTNNHVIADAADGGRITVMFSDGARVRAELVGRSPSYDLAIIKLTGSHPLTPLPVGDSEAVRVGEPVVAIGSPLALASTVTQGIVSAKNRPVVVNSDGGADSPSAYINGIQTDAAINPGNSGGPLVDAAARVIGVNSAILTLGQSRDTSGNIGLGFAIPINQAMEIGKLLIEDGKATYPVIGVNVGQADGDGVRLSQVDGDGPADEAGLQVDDVVTAIDDQPVTTAEELIVAVRTHRPGDRVTLTYERGGQQRTAEVTLGSREG
jgi:putative serine protease PepD